MTSAGSARRRLARLRQPAGVGDQLREERRDALDRAMRMRVAAVRAASVTSARLEDGKSVAASIARSCLNAGHQPSRRGNIASAMPGSLRANGAAAICRLFKGSSLALSPGFDAAVSHSRGNAAFPKRFDCDPGSRRSHAWQPRRGVRAGARRVRPPGCVCQAAGAGACSPRASRCVRRPREPAFDPAAIMASIGEAPYEWSIDTDMLTWGANAAEVLKVGSLAAIASGRDYAKLLAADAATSRFDAVMKSPARDDGAGVPYQVQYCLQPAGARQRLWIEDNGRWFAGADGKPGARARRRPRHQRAPRPRGAARLSVALRRPDRRDEPLCI